MLKLNISLCFVLFVATANGCLWGDSEETPRPSLCGPQLQTTYDEIIAQIDKEKRQLKSISDKTTKACEEFAQSVSDENDSVEIDQFIEKTKKDLRLLGGRFDQETDRIERDAVDRCRPIFQGLEQKIKDANERAEKCKLNIINPREKYKMLCNGLTSIKDILTKELDVARKEDCFIADARDNISCFRTDLCLKEMKLKTVENIVSIKKPIKNVLKLLEEGVETFNKKQPLPCDIEALANEYTPEFDSFVGSLRKCLYGELIPRTFPKYGNRN